MAEKPKKPQKHVLKSLELTTLLVALDHLEEYGPGMAVADPYQTPGDCVYLAYVGEEQLAALTARLPHRNVRFLTPSAGSRRKVVRKVFNKEAILHLLRFSFPLSDDAFEFARGLDLVDRKYWTVLDDDGEPIPRPRGKTKGKG